MSKFKYDDIGVVGRKTGIRVGSVTKDDDGLENLDEFFSEGFNGGGGSGGADSASASGSNNNNNSTMDIVNSEQVTPRSLMKHSNRKPRHSLLTSRLLREAQDAQDADSDSESHTYQFYNKIPSSQPLQPPIRDRDSRQLSHQDQDNELNERRQRVRRMEHDRIIQQQQDEEHAADEERREVEKSRKRNFDTSTANKKVKKDKKDKSDKTDKKDKSATSSSKKRKPHFENSPTDQRKDRRTSGEKIRERRPTPMDPSDHEDHEKEYLDRIRRHSKGKRKQGDESTVEQPEHPMQPEQLDQYDQQYSPSPPRAPIHINDGGDDDSIILDQEYQPEPEPELGYANGVDNMLESDSENNIQEESRKKEDAKIDKKKRRQIDTRETSKNVTKTTSNKTNDEADALRRSSRPRHRPLAEWALERTDFAGNIIAPPPVVQSTQQTQTSLKERKKRAAQSAARNNKQKEIELHKTLEKYTTTSYPVKNKSGKTIKRDIAYREKHLKIDDLKKEYEFKKIFQEPEHMASGVMVIDKGKEKPYKESNDNCYVFYIIDGAARVGLNQSHEFNISLGGSFYIPRMNQYKIRNIGNSHLKLFFTQIRIPEPVEGNSKVVTNTSANAATTKARLYDPPQEESEQESDESDADAGSQSNGSPPSQAHSISFSSPSSVASPTSSQSPPPRRLAYLSD
ncbi:hypothetical protein E3P91_03755 [Wallemia ichthyophaga]|nr:hypothetical protein E3P91_03755 [Wallemia ichthyophaga]